MNTQVLWLLIKFIYRPLNLGLLLCCFMFISPLARANYVPPADQKPPSERTKSAGSRGCPEANIPLTILAPKTYVGYTASLRPTFVWFLNDSQQSDFRLFEFDNTNGKYKQVGKTIQLQTAPGINQHSLPKDHPALSVGKRYLWQVGISCPNGVLYQRAEFQVVEMPLALKINLPSKADSSQKAILYAKQGLWYEALEEALKLAPEGKLGTLGATLVQSLTESEKQPRERQQSHGIEPRDETLTAIAQQQR